MFLVKACTCFSAKCHPILIFKDTVKKSYFFWKFKRKLDVNVILRCDNHLTIGLKYPTSNWTVFSAQKKLDWDRWSEKLFHAPFHLVILKETLKNCVTISLFPTLWLKTKHFFYGLMGWIMFEIIELKQIFYDNPYCKGICYVIIDITSHDYKLKVSPIYHKK